MTVTPEAPNIATQATSPASDERLLTELGLRRSNKVVLVVDLVESVRLMEEDELATVKRWRAFLTRVSAEVLPRQEGKLVKSMGDGLMIEFASARQSAGAAHQLHLLTQDPDFPLDADELRVRVGIHSAAVYADEQDLYGVGVNLAARMTTLAEPGQTVISDAVRAELADGVDGCLEDLGDCHLKHVPNPVRLWRLHPASRAIARPWTSLDLRESLLPSIAVLPFGVNRPDDPSTSLLAQMLADGVTAHLSSIGQMRVTSHMSSQHMRPFSTILEVAQSLDVNYIVRGSMWREGDQVRVTYALASVRTEEMLDSGSMGASVGSWSTDHLMLAKELASRVTQCLLQHSCESVAHHPLPNSQGYALLLAAISLTHRQSVSAFMQVPTILEHLIQRHPRHTLPHAWYAKWHVLSLAQGWTNNPAWSIERARSSAIRGLDLDPGNATALAIYGLVKAFADRKFDDALDAYDSALASNPNESLALLFRSAALAYTDQGKESVSYAHAAIARTPLDPIRYYYENFAMTAALAAGRYELAVAHGEESFRLNRHHASTLRLLAVSHALQGDMSRGKYMAQLMLRHEPAFSLDTFRKRSPASDAPYFGEFLRALRSLGIPESS